MSSLLRLILLSVLFLSGLTAAHAVMNLGMDLGFSSGGQIEGVAVRLEGSRKVLRVGHLPVT